MTEPISIFSAAKRLGEKSGWTLTHLQMQKLLYMAHMYYLGMRGKPLVYGNFEAWAYGPVHPELYHYLKKYVFGADPVPASAFLGIASVSDSHPGVAFLDATLTQLPRDRLVAITHWDQGAWYKNYHPDVMGVMLSNEAIKEEYRCRESAAHI